MKTLTRVGLLLLTLLALAVALTHRSVSAETAAPDDTPTVVLNDITGYTMYKNVLYWYTVPTCPSGGGGPNRDAEDPVTIKRGRSTGGDARTLFSRNDPRPVGTCNPYNIRSNLAIDGTYVYWLDNNGLQRLPTTAIPGDPLVQLAPLTGGGEVADGGLYLYVQTAGVIRAYEKGTGALTVVYGGSPTASNLQYDGRFLYFIASGALKALDPLNNHNVLNLFNKVDSYDAPGPQSICGDSNFQWTVSYGAVSGYQYLNYASNPLETLRFGDFNGDGKTDVFSTLPRAAGGYQWVYSSGGVAGYINGAWDFADPADLRLGDFNGDHKTDIFYAAALGNGNYQWKYSSGAVGGYVNLTGANVPPQDLRFGDFNGDGKTDVFAVLDQGGGLLTWVISSAGTGAFSTINGAGAPLDQLAFADLNNDGKTDVFRAFDLGNGLYQWQYSSAGSGAWVNLRQEPYSVNDVAFGNFLGDGRADIFVTDLRPDGLYQWRASDGGVAALQNLAYAHPLSQLRFGDFDGNGLTDAFTALSRDFCRTMLPVFYAYKETGAFANASGIGGRVRWHDLNSGQSGLLTNSPYELFGQGNTAFANFDIYDDVATTENYYFFAEKFKHYCTISPGCFITPTRTTLQRMTLSRDVYKGYLSNAPSLLFLNERNYSTPADVFDMAIANDQDFVHWRDYRALYRLSVNAAALPVINLRVTGIEVTQGLQNTSNTVRLIRGKETTVRVFVKSDGVDVRNVSADLRVYKNGVLTSVFHARNPLTVRGTPDRLNLSHQFLFQLPLYVVDGNNIRVEALLNPLGYPLEPAGMTADNTLSSATLTLSPSPSLEVIFVEFNYFLNNANQVPQTTSKNAQWISNAYPLGYTLVNDGYEFGLDWSVWSVDDAGLAARVNWNTATCANQMTHVCGAYYSCKNGALDPDKDDNRNLCASDYTNGRLTGLRSQRAIGPLPFLYGEIRDTGVANQFPRGQAGVGRSSSGPDGVGWIGYYAGHEVGHTLGLGHPLVADGNCGLDGSDPIPNYPNGAMGPVGDTLNGLTWADFDGNGTFEQSLLRGSQWVDFMGYCPNALWPHQWVSDQNYERMYNNMSARRSSAAQLAAGDWLALIGSIDAAGEVAALTVAERWDSAVLPAIVAGDFAVRLRAAGGDLLSETAFSADLHSDSSRRPFEVIVPFVAGTRNVQIVRLSDDLIVAERAISASAPTISAVTVVEEDDHINVGWTAGDSDGDTLHFDLYISHDAGATFRPLSLGVTGTTAAVALAQTGGGSVIVQVVASDGVQTASAESPPTALTAQPPVIVNFEPDCSIPLNYGQPVTFRADVIDPQDGALKNEALEWYKDGQFEGFGAVSFDGSLRTGNNTITLIATNSLGATASADCLLFVDDDQTNPETRLSVAPQQVEWLVDSGALTPQSALLTFSNEGGGTLNWTATSDQLWLTLATDAGSAPGTLEISADASGMASGSINHATVTITGYDANGTVTNTRVIPVTLWVDHPGYLPPLVGGSVPTVLRLTQLQSSSATGLVYGLLGVLVLTAVWLSVRRRTRRS